LLNLHKAKRQSEPSQQFGLFWMLVLRAFQAHFLPMFCEQ